jgi:hypothetical protein
MDLGSLLQFPLADLLRKSVYSRLSGCKDVNDAGGRAQDPAFRLMGPEKIWERGTALTPRLQSFETDVQAGEENFAGPARINEVRLWLSVIAHNLGNLRGRLVLPSCACEGARGGAFVGRRRRSTGNEGEERFSETPLDVH